MHKWIIHKYSVTRYQQRFENNASRRTSTYNSICHMRSILKIALERNYVSRKFAEHHWKINCWDGIFDITLTKVCIIALTAYAQKMCHTIWVTDLDIVASDLLSDQKLRSIEPFLAVQQIGSRWTNRVFSDSKTVPNWRWFVLMIWHLMQTL